MTNDEVKILERIIGAYGKANQSMKACEECGELIRAISRISGAKNYDDWNEAKINLIEEIADVEIMIDQLKIMYGILGADISFMRTSKLARMETRLSKDGF